MGVLAAVGVASAQTTPERLTQGRKAFEKSLAEVVAGYEGQVGGWPEEYLREVEALSDEARRVGDLDRVLVVRTESERFQKNRVLPPAGKLDKDPDLRAIQDKYMALQQQWVLDRDRQILARRDKYVVSLEDAKRRLTQSGQIEDAVLVDGEIKQIQAMPQITAAEFSLAAERSALPKPVKPVAKPEPGAPLAEKPGAAAPTGPIRLLQASPEVALEPARRTPSDSAFKSQALRPTSLAGSLQVRLGCAAYMKQTTAQRRSVDRQTRSSSYYSSSSSGSTSSEYALALVLRARRVGDAMTALRVTVQYFATREDSGSSAELITSRFATLSHIDASGGVLTFPGVSTEMQTSSSRYGSSYSGGSSRTYRSGSQFTGVMVTVTDKEGTLLHQSTSNSGLEGFAAAALEENKKVSLSPSALESTRKAYEEARDALQSANQALVGKAQDSAAKARRDAAQRAHDTARAAYDAARRAAGQ